MAVTLIPAAAAQAPRVSGPLRAGHVVTLDFDGPSTSETDSTNPFTFYRLDVTFQRGGRSMVIPGHYAADGNSAQSGAEGGRVWRVFFRPDEPGNWNWSASFRTGPNVVWDGGGSPTAFDGVSGNLSIGAPLPSDPEYVRRGPLRYVGERYLRFAFTDEPFLEGGSNSPENLLAYADIDGTVDAGGIVPDFLHRFEPHRTHFNSLGGGESWRGNKGEALLGAINWLSSRGVNSMYAISLTAYGDGDDVWPWISRTNHWRYDVSKLDQWGRVFHHAAKCGVHVHMVLCETENEAYFEERDGAAFFANSRRLYYREMISRFGHLPALTWNLGEENGWNDFSRSVYRAPNSDAQRRAFAAYIHGLDAQDHPVSVHTYHGPRVGEDQDGVYGALLDPSKPTAPVEMASLQGPFQPQTSVNADSDDRSANNHAKVVQWVEDSEAAGKPWVVASQEQRPANLGAVTDGDSRDPDHSITRRDILWGTLMGGGAGVQYYFGYAFRNSSGDDLTAERFDTRSQLWDQTTFALDFFREHLPFTSMVPADDRVSDPRAFCLADPGRIFAVYLRDGGTTQLDLGSDTGLYELLWFDACHGGALQVGSRTSVSGPGQVSLGQPPSNPSLDWVVVARRVSIVPGSGCAGAAAPEVTSAPRIGRTFSFDCAPCEAGGLPTLAVGNRPVTDLILSAPLACSTPCVFALETLVGKQGFDSHSSNIPMRPSLIGATFRVQCGCITTCLELSPALDLQIVE